MSTRPNYALKKWIRATIYAMKREYGGSITIYELVSADTDLETGIKTATYNSYPIARAVVLPLHAMRQVIQGISLISANKKLVQGGTFDAGDRVFIIDRKDVPATFELEKDDWIEYDGKRYDIKYVDEYEPETSWLVLGKVIEGVVPELHHRTYSRDTVTLEQSASRDTGPPRHALVLTDTASATVE